MPLVSTIMSGPVVAVGPGATAVEAAREMATHDTGDVVVVRNSHVVGILTDRDIALRLVAEGMNPDTPVSDVCTIDPVTIRADAEIAEAAELMRQHAVRRLPVCDAKGSVVGFVTLGDLSGATNTDATLADISAARPQR
jgi:CBS domain-containing protein